MSDWADKKAEEMCCGEAPIYNERLGAMEKRLAQALREAEARGIERAAVVSDEYGCGEETKSISAGAFGDKYQDGMGNELETLSDAIRKLKEQPPA